MKRSLDHIDRRILDELQDNGRLSIVDLAKRVHLTKTPCSERVRRLEKQGVIGGYSASLDAEAVGLSQLTLVHVSLKHTNADVLESFNRAVKKVPEIQSCLMVAGSFDYMLKVRTRDITHFRTLLGETISKLPGLLQTHSFAVMEAVKDDSRIQMSGSDSLVQM